MDHRSGGNFDVRKSMLKRFRVLLVLLLVGIGIAVYVHTYLSSHSADDSIDRERTEWKPLAPVSVPVEKNLRTEPKPVPIEERESLKRQETLEIWVYSPEGECLSNADIQFRSQGQYGWRSAGQSRQDGFAVPVPQVDTYCRVHYSGLIADSKLIRAGTSGRLEYHLPWPHVVNERGVTIKGTIGLPSDCKERSVLRLASLDERYEEKAWREPDWPAQNYWKRGEMRPLTEDGSYWIGMVVPQSLVNRAWRLEVWWAYGEEPVRASRTQWIPIALGQPFRVQIGRMLDLGHWQVKSPSRIQARLELSGAQQSLEMKDAVWLLSDYESYQEGYMVQPVLSWEGTGDLDSLLPNFWVGRHSVLEVQRKNLWKALPPFTLRAGVQDLGVLRFPEPGYLDIQVQNQNTGQVEGMHLVYVENLDLARLQTGTAVGLSSFRFSAATTQRVRTDARGQYRLGPVTPGFYRLAAKEDVLSEAAVYGPEQTVQVRSGKSTPVQLVTGISLHSLELDVFIRQARRVRSPLRIWIWEASHSLPRSTEIRLDRQGRGRASAAFRSGEQVHLHGAVQVQDTLFVASYSGRMNRQQSVLEIRPSASEIVLPDDLVASGSTGFLRAKQAPPGFASGAPQRMIFPLRRDPSPESSAIKKIRGLPAGEYEVLSFAKGRTIVVWEFIMGSS